MLGVAPYEALRNSMLRLANSRDDIDLDVYVANLEDGVALVKDLEHNSYDAIISRGGTAEAITRVTTIPVVDISLSVYDILRAIRLAENYQAQYAIIGFPNITETAHLLCDLLQYRIRIVTIQSAEDVESALNTLREEGCNMIICDMISQDTASKMNMNSILITSGAESIFSAFDQVRKICQSHYAIREENSFLRSILQDNGSYTVVMEQDGTVFLSTWDHSDADHIHEMLAAELHSILRGGDRKIFRSVEKTLYSVSSRTASYKNKKYVIFYFTASKIPLNSGKYGIRFLNKEDIEKDYYESFFSIAGALGNLASQIEDIARSARPIMIMSEEGTGKEYIAGLVYIESENTQNPLITIDCSMLNDRNWEYLINNYNSPLNDNGNTIYFRNIEALTPPQHKKLLSLFLDSNLHRRNRLLFSTCGSDNGEVSQYLREYVKRLSCATVNMQTLRSRRGEIQALAGLYLSRINLELGKQLMGFEPQALSVLKEYSWPTNYSQFERVLLEAASMTATAYITADTIAGLVASEQASSAYNTLFRGGEDRLPALTLEELCQNFIRKVLKDNGGNQSKTAAQLGISRSTLWRYLQKGN